MENKNVLVLVGAALVVLLVGGFFLIGKSLDNQKDVLGSALANSSARGSMELRTQLSDMIKDFTGATYSAAYNPASMPSSTANGALGYASTTVTVTGAAVGDKVAVDFGTSTSADLWVASGKVTAADTVVVHILNLGGVALDLGSATLRVKVTSSTPLSTTSF